jgi:hypothetical protein
MLSDSEQRIEDFTILKGFVREKVKNGFSDSDAGYGNSEFRQAIEKLKSTSKGLTEESP